MAFQGQGRPPAAFRRWGEAGSSRPAASGPALRVVAFPERDPVPEPEPEPEPEPIDLEALLAEAREAGRREARAELEAELGEAVAEAEAAGAALAEALHDVTTLRRRSLEQSAEDVAELVLLFARRVVDRSLALHPDALPALVKDAVAQLPDREDLSIAVAPHLAEQLARSLPRELRERVVADTELANGCVVRTQHVSIEATLAHASDGLERAVKTWLSEQWWAVAEGDDG